MAVICLCGRWEWLEHIMKLITQLVTLKKHSVMRGTRHQVLRFEDQSTILMLEAVKPLGDGVDLGLNISNTEMISPQKNSEMAHKTPGVQVFLLHSASNQVIPLKNTKI